MADHLADVDASIGLDFTWGERRGSGVVFHRQNARVSASNRYGADGTLRSDAPAAGSGDDGASGEASNKFGGTTVDKQETIMLPHSTYTFLFTEDVISISFFFAVFVLLVSVACLGLALWDNLSKGSPGNPLGVPVNVSHQVRAAQYLSILVALTMEEEIPTGTYLMRMIPRSSVEQKLGVPYSKFVISSCLRLLMGYLFLLNVFLAVIQSNQVLEMFYDMLALNFVALMDDIAFRLAKYDVLGKRLRNAASAAGFGVEFEKRPYMFRKKTTLFVKFIYIFNLLVALCCLTAVGILQRTGAFQCDSVTITFGDEIWEEAFVQTSPSGRYDTMVLVYSFFGGVYKQEGTNAGRPVYREVRKSEDSPFEDKIGALLLYCEEEGAWVFRHELIRKSEAIEESDCPWLLRSPDTDAFDILEVSGAWSIWVGVINKDAEVSITCNGCKSDVECNLNGACVEGRCNCNSAVGHYGVHCELREPCPNIIGKRFNDTWEVTHKRNCEPLHMYGRPVYNLRHVDDALRLSNDVARIEVDDNVNLMYTGSRFFAVVMKGGKNLPIEALEHIGKEFHAFWDRAFDNGTVVVSDPTTKSFPVGIDFYRVGERGEEYGPYGLLYPLEWPPGSGNFRCVDNLTKHEDRLDAHNNVTGHVDFDVLMPHCE